MKAQSDANHELNRNLWSQIQGKIASLASEIRSMGFVFEDCRPTGSPNFNEIEGLGIYLSERGKTLQRISSVMDTILSNQATAATELELYYNKKIDGTVSECARED